jgi:hypothetical protein
MLEYIFDEINDKVKLSPKQAMGAYRVVRS